MAIEKHVTDRQIIWTHNDLPQPIYRVTIVVERFDGKAIAEREAVHAAKAAYQEMPQ